MAKVDRRRATAWHARINKIVNDHYSRKETTGSKFDRYIEKEFIPLHVFEDPAVIEELLDFFKNKK